MNKKSLTKPFKLRVSVRPVFAGGGEGQGSSVLLQKDPKAMKIWSFLKLLGDFRDFLEEVTHFVSKIPVRIYCWAGRREQSL